VTCLQGAVASIAAGGVLSNKMVQHVVLLILRIPEPSAKPFGERLVELTASLTRASDEVDLVLHELAPSGPR
jgi:hypothetical protein